MRPILEEDDLLGLGVLRIVAHAHPLPCSRIKAISPSGLAKTLSRNEQHDAFRPGFYLLDVGPPAKRLDLNHLQQVFDFGRQFAETIDKFRSKTVDVAFVLNFASRR